MSEIKTKIKAKLEYYPRRSVRGRLSIVRNVNRKQGMMDKLTNPYAQGIYTGAAAVGMITGMAMMARRKGVRAEIDRLKKAADTSFGYPCGNSFTSDRHKCYTDPKTGARLKKPITRGIYDKIMKSGGKAAKELYKDREDRIRSSRRDGAKGWKKDKQQPPIGAHELTKQELKDRIKAAPDNLYEDPWTADWGTGRGQGRRRGGAVQGAMSGLARGKVTYKNMAGKLNLNKDDSFDFNGIPDKAAQSEYVKARAAGLNHNDSMLHVDNLLDPKIDNHKISVKNALDRGDKVPDKVLKEYPDLAKSQSISDRIKTDKPSTGERTSIPANGRQKQTTPIEGEKQYQAELKVVNDRLATQYHRFSRTDSPKVAPPDPALHRKKNELERKLGLAPKQLHERNYTEVKGQVTKGVHRQQIERAIDRGDKVPEHVIAEYPSLKDYQPKIKPPAPSIKELQSTARSLSPEDHELFAQDRRFAAGADGDKSAAAKWDREILNARARKKATTKLTLDKVETSADREKFAAQQLADAKARGDKKDVKSWEDAAKSTRKARVNESIAKSKQTQGSLFDTTTMDDSPLMRSLREKSNFGYACGSTFIPDSAKCYTDPKTRARLKVPLTKTQVERARSKSPGAEKLYSEQEESIKGRLRGGIIPPEYQAAARSTGATKVLPSGIAEVDPKNLNLDPKRFQYKLVSGSTGESGSLTGVRKWDSNLAGVQLAWHDPADDKTYVINGHNRTNLAKKLGVDSVTTRFINAKNAKEARSTGAIVNIAEGNGTSLDAAKFFRDSNLTQDDLTKKGIPLKSQVATEGISLSKLNDGLFNKVVQGDLSKERGVIIGKNLSDHKEQSELVDLINKQEKKGKKITNEGISELTDMIQSAPKKQAEGGFLGMLGFSPEARSLAVEKAEIQAHIKRQLSTDKKLFGTVGRGRNAAKLERGGNKIDSEQSSAISADAERALRVFDQEKRYSGKTADAINAAAERIAKGEKSAKVKDEVYKQVLDLIK